MRLIDNEEEISHGQVFVPEIHGRKCPEGLNMIKVREFQWKENNLELKINDF